MLFRCTLTPRSIDTGGGKLWLIGILVALALYCVPSLAAADPYGAHFGLADSAPSTAFPGAKAFWAGTCDLGDASTAAGGVGSAPGVRSHCIDVGKAQVGCDPDLCPPFGSGAEITWEPGQEPAWRLDPVTSAGAHPDATAALWLQRSPEWVFGVGTYLPQPDGDPKNITVGLPPGVIGNPNAVAKCSSAAARTTPPSCPPQSQVGVVTIVVAAEVVGSAVNTMPVYNVEPRDGNTAELIFGAGVNSQALANIPVIARARTEGDFGVDTFVTQVPGGVPLLGQTITLWGVPWAASHDKWRAPAGYQGPGGHIRSGLPPDGLPDTATGAYPPNAQPQSYDSDWGPIRPFFSNPTECSPQPPVTTIEMEMWQRPFTKVSEDSVAPAVTDCDEVAFGAGLDLQPTSSVADSASGLSVDLSVPQNDDPPADVATDPDDGAGAPAHWRSVAGRATSQLDEVVVTLPAGAALNPASAAGLAGCSDAAIGLTQAGTPPLFNNNDPFDGQGAECPQGSIVGTVEVETPLLDEKLTGQLVLGTPKSTDPQSGEMFRLFVVVRNHKRGLLAKIAGSAVADPATGKLTTTFQRNPRVPFAHMHLELKGGQRGVLGLPQRCTSSPWSALLTPWTAAHGGGGVAAPQAGSFVTNSNCGFGFSPALHAGMSSARGGGSGSFSFKFSRKDGEQWLKGLTAQLPAGLLASVRDVPLCTNAQAAAAACPAASRIGRVDAGAGSGAPLFLEKKGSVHLTEGYKGAPYGLAVIQPVEAGPFTGPLALKTLVVRQALRVDPSTAQVTAESDPLPRIWHGIPLRVREVTVTVDRLGFMRNPTDCSSKAIVAAFGSMEGTSATRVQRFQASECRSLAFDPSLALRLTGRRQTKTGRHPGIRATVKQADGQAGIERAEVRLPDSLALDADNARALCEYEEGIKPEPACPRGSIVGTATAVSPLLRAPLRGNVYFVKNVRVDPTTGNRIRTLPMIVVALRGEIAVNLRGESSVYRGRLVNTFAALPDAPISSFVLNIRGGRRGILVVTHTPQGARINICRWRQTSETYLDGHNGRRKDVDVWTKTPCARNAKTRRSAHRKRRPHGRR